MFMLGDSVQGECAALLMQNEVGSIPTPPAILESSCKSAVDDLPWMQEADGSIPSS